MQSGTEIRFEKKLLEVFLFFFLLFFRSCCRALDLAAGL